MKNRKGSEMQRTKLAVSIALALAGIANAPDASAKIGTNAIIGTGGPKANAIIGTGADAIIGTGRTKVAASDAIIGTGRPESLALNIIIGSGKRRLLHLAPVDSVDTRANLIRTLGKTFRVPDAKAIADRLAAGENLLAAVDGKLDADGKITESTLRLMANSYLAGASKLLLVGRVASVDTRVGSLKIGAVTVDITAAEGARAPKPGELVAIVGTQPIRGGVMLAERIGLR